MDNYFVVYVGGEKIAKKKKRNIKEKNRNNARTWVAYIEIVTSHFRFHLLCLHWYFRMICAGGGEHICVFDIAIEFPNRTFKCQQCLFIQFNVVHSFSDYGWFAIDRQFIYILSLLLGIYRKSMDYLQLYCTLFAMWFGSCIPPKNDSGDEIQFAHTKEHLAAAFTAKKVND